MINAVITQFGNNMIKVNADTIRMLIEDNQRREEAREERRLKERAEDIERENNAGGRPHRSVIKIHPQVKWPVLEDSDTDPKEFYREFEHVCRMCNDGQGMIPKEKLAVLLNSLRGHRKKIYNLSLIHI